MVGSGLEYSSLVYSIRGVLRLDFTGAAVLCGSTARLCGSADLAARLLPAARLCGSTVRLGSARLCGSARLDCAARLCGSTVPSRDITYFMLSDSEVFCLCCDNYTKMFFQKNAELLGIMRNSLVKVPFYAILI